MHDDRETLAGLIAAEIVAEGPMPFGRYVERALYEPNRGFYEVTGRAGGRRGDFVTSVETGPLFAAMVGEWLDRRWDEAGRPARFHVAEAGAGVGTLWRGVRRAEPRCGAALRWDLVERSARQRDHHVDLIDDRCSSTDELPERCDVIVANELLDNLVFDVVECTDDGWRELRVGLTSTIDPASAGAGASVDPRFCWVHGPLAPPPSKQTAWPSGLAVGSRLPAATGAQAWVESARSRADVVLIADYGASMAELAVRGSDGWLRTFSGHGRAAGPFVEPGSCDITHDVPFDQLPVADVDVAQHDWLTDLGISKAVEEARKTWTERAGVGDLAAMFARSAIGEADALLDLDGLGGFRVLEWHSRRSAGAIATV